MVKIDVTELLALLPRVLEIGVDVLGAIVVVVVEHHIDAGLVVGVEMERFEVVADVANLAEEALDPVDLLGGVCEGDILSFRG